MGENLVGEKKGWGGLVCPCAVNGLRLDDGMNKGVTLDGCFFKISITPPYICKFTMTKAFHMVRGLLMWLFF